MEESLGEDGQEIFAPLTDDQDISSRFHYFEHYDFVPEETKELEKRLYALTDILKRRDAYFALNDHFGGDSTVETVTREEVIGPKTILVDNYVDIRFRG